jgi:hypothetical protein
MMLRASASLVNESAGASVTGSGAQSAAGASGPPAIFNTMSFAAAHNERRPLGSGISNVVKKAFHSALTLRKR